MKSTSRPLLSASPIAIVWPAFTGSAVSTLVFFILNTAMVPVILPSSVLYLAPAS